MKQEVLKSLQNVELQILSVIDDFCFRYQIKYSLYGGTLIGAVRHQGFIPWDDDIDIVMLRGEYEKFLKIWKENPVDGYYLENYLVDSNTPNTHTKIRKNGTILLSSVEDENIGHHGIWIDIFVMDKISENTVLGRRTLKAGKSIILLTKANGQLPGESWKNQSIRKILRFLFPEKIRKKILEKQTLFLHENNELIANNYYYCDMCTFSYLKVKFPIETGEKYDYLLFEGKLFPVFSNYDSILRIMYGDYMQLPPISEQVCKHNPKKISI